MNVVGPYVLILFSAAANLVAVFFLYRACRERSTALQENSISIESVSEILEQERSRISSELHDELGTLVSIIHLDLELVMQEATTLTPYAENKLLEVRRNLTLVTESIRTNIWNLSSQMFDQVDIASALRELCHKLDGHKGTHVAFVQSGIPVSISPKEKVNIFRIIQELLANAMKHSMAWNLSIHLHWERDKLIATVEDDGSTYAQQKPSKDGMGTINITRRANLIGAIVEREKLKKGSRTIITLKKVAENPSVK